ncbi:hypothetical protein [Clostridium neonatale]|uniref:hypothetical protein n=1 Tax=Clostridium neonatale TaxID=137838 RepID=UPI0029372729|nr:hypothetical protein [Clostridium neonatale]
MIDDSINFRYSIEASTNDNVILYEIQEDENKEVKREIIFNGIIENVRTTNIDGVHYLEIEALTSSSLLDIQEKSRSFQDEKMSYDDLINEILKDYVGFGFGQCMSMPMRIEKPLFQYKETDYEFLKRIASQLGLELISDIINLTNMFYFGKPIGKSYIVNDDVNYNAVKDLDKYHKISASNGNLHDTDYFYYEVNLRESMKIGDSIKLKNIDFYINQYKAEYIKGELIYKYRFCREKGIWQEKIYNKKLSGISLEGTVLETTGEILKLKLNIDEKQDINKAAWFVYAPPTGNILYSMPLVGDNVMLYFQNEYDRPVVTGCVRKNGSTFGRCANPDNRYYATESGNYLDMLPGAINFYRGGMNVCFNDESGISLSSNNNLNIGTQGGISMSAGNVSISGSNKLIVSKGKGGFISLEGELYNEATVVYENGSCREPFAPFNDDIPNLSELLALRAEIQLNKFNPNGNAIASAVAGNQAVGGECYITQDNGNSVPIVSDELKITKYDPWKKLGADGMFVQNQARNGKYYLGTVKYNKDLGMSEFTPIDKKGFEKDNSCFTADYWKSVGNGIAGGINKYSTEARNSLDYIGENWLGLDYDRSCVDNPNVTMRDNINKANELDAKNYNELRENSSYKRTFDDTSKNTKFTLNAIDTALAVHGVQQISSACVDYARLNKPYINAKAGIVKDNTALLRQAINNVNKKPRGTVLGVNGGNASNYISDVNKELKKLKNIKSTGTKIVSEAKIDNVNELDDIIKGGNKTNFGFKYKHNPSDNPKVLKDAIEDPNAVYGYRPSEDGSLASFVKGEWDDPIAVEGYRQDRIAYHNRNEGAAQQMVSNMFSEGASTEDVARAVNEYRNQSRIQAYIDSNGNIKNIDGYNAALVRAEKNSYENLIKSGKTPEQIIKSATKGNPGMDACTGLYDEYFDTY